MTEVFEWNNYRKLCDDDKLKDILIRSAYHQWLRGNDVDEDWGTTERMLSYDMFKAGFIACQSILNPPRIINTSHD